MSDLLWCCVGYFIGRLVGIAQALLKARRPVGSVQGSGDSE